jgi:uncharacterized protein YhfF
MQKTPLTDAMWAEYRRATGLSYNEYDVAAFGRGAGLETKLAELVLVGQKRATASLLRSFALDSAPLPVIGGYWIVVDSQDNPRCILRTMEL